MKISFFLFSGIFALISFSNLSAEIYKEDFNYTSCLHGLPSACNHKGIELEKALIADIKDLRNDLFDNVSDLNLAEIYKSLSQLRRVADNAILFYNIGCFVEEQSDKKEEEDRIKNCQKLFEYSTAKVSYYSVQLPCLTGSDMSCDVTAYSALKQLTCPVPVVLSKESDCWNVRYKDSHKKEANLPVCDKE